MAGNLFLRLQSLVRTQSPASLISAQWQAICFYGSRAGRAQADLRVAECPWAGWDMGYGIWHMGWGGVFHLPSPIFQVRPLGWRLDVRFDAAAQEPVQR